jgi:hypothetical protein
MEGQWSNGMLHGKGCIKNYDLHRQQWIKNYEGDFKDG